MKTILVVDDDQMMLELYQMKFTHLGYNVAVVSDPAEFMTAVLNNKPALIFLDRRLGQADGLDLLKVLRKQEAGKSLPVIMLSNLDPTAEEFAAVKDLGPSEYLIKEHVDLKDLGAKVKALIGGANS